jgi:HSP20 family molecular chaperone IbpA
MLSKLKSANRRSSCGRTIAAALKKDVPSEPDTMSTIKIEDVGSRSDVAAGLTKQFDDLIDRVRHRAYALFEERTGEHGSDLQDWFRAEEELLFPAKFEVTQEPGTYNLSISLSGLAAQNLRIYILQNGLFVKSNPQGVYSARGKQSTNGSPALFYWWPLPAGANVPGIIAELKHNRLEIKIPIVRKAQSIEIEAPGKETADAKKTAAA